MNATVSSAGIFNYRMGQKTWQMLTYFQNSFTAQFSGQLAIKWLLNISPHLKDQYTFLIKALSPLLNGIYITSMLSPH